jgi:hypothetical protein
MKRICLCMIMLLLLLSSLAQAATYYVATTGSDANPGTQAQPFKTIGKGIAVAAANGDTVLLADGTYNERNLDFGMKNLVLQSQSNNPHACILDCQQTGRGIRIAGGQNAATTVGGLTIQNGNIGTDNDAGGMLIVNASPKLTNCIFTGNINNFNNGFTASALYVDLSSNPTITGCTFHRHNDPSFSLSGTIVLAGGAGATMTNCNFSRNLSMFGGISLYAGTLTLKNCNFTDNLATWGAGIHQLGGMLAMDSCTFTGNAAGFGGAIAQRGGALVADRCVFTGNYATGPYSNGGGAIQAGLVDMTLTNCLFANNATAADDIGIGVINAESIALLRSGITSPVKIVNCTFVGNWTGETTVANIVADNANVVMVNSIVRGGDSSLGDIHTSGGSVSVTYSNTQRGFAGTGNITADPLFVNAATGNYRLQPTSPCLNKGSAAAPNLPAIDLDGAPRIMGSAPEMGTYETWLSSYGTWYVDKALGNDTTGTGSPTTPFKTVVKAITSASNGHKIYIKQGNYGTDKPRITKSLRLFNWGNTGLSRIGQP